MVFYVYYQKCDFVKIVEKNYHSDVEFFVLIPVVPTIATKKTKGDKKRNAGS